MWRQTPFISWQSWFSDANRAIILISLSHKRRSWCMRIGSPHSRDVKNHVSCGERSGRSRCHQRSFKLCGDISPTSETLLAVREQILHHDAHPSQRRARSSGRRPHCIHADVLQSDDQGSIRRSLHASPSGDIGAPSLTTARKGRRGNSLVHHHRDQAPLGHDQSRFLLAQVPRDFNTRANMYERPPSISTVGKRNAAGSEGGCDSKRWHGR